MSDPSRKRRAVIASVDARGLTPSPPPRPKVALRPDCRSLHKAAALQCSMGRESGKNSTGTTHELWSGRRIFRPYGKGPAAAWRASWQRCCWAPGGTSVALAAEEAVDCASINTGHLDVALASDSSTLRTVEMNEGDTLAFTFRADARATGTITLVTGDGSEQRLLYGPHATQVSYTADRPGAVAFRLATKGGKVATFVTTCTPAHAQSANAERGSAQRRSMD